MRTRIQGGGETTTKGRGQKEQVDFWQDGQSGVGASQTRLREAR